MTKSPRSGTLLAVPLIFAVAMGACKAVSRTIGTAGSRDVTPQQFVEYYEQPKRDDRYWAYIGKVSGHYYMEYYCTIDKTYPEYAGEIRVPVDEMPRNFPATQQGVHYDGYVYPEPKPTPEESAPSP